MSIAEKTDHLADLAADLADTYLEGRAGGPGLITQLQTAIGDRRRTSPGREGTNPNKPGSRPPGWREDISELLADIHWGTDDHWAKAGFSTPLDLRKAVRLLPDITTNPIAAAEDLREWRRLARITLGYQIPSVGLPDVVCIQPRYGRGGRHNIGCQQATLRISEDMNSDVWCANELCHDDDTYPHCDKDPETGRSQCRRTSRDLRHSIRWTRDQIARMTGDVA